jgi:hypothetical protein
MTSTTFSGRPTCTPHSHIHRQQRTSSEKANSIAVLTKETNAWASRISSSSMAHTWAGSPMLRSTRTLGPGTKLYASRRHSASSVLPASYLVVTKFPVPCPRALTRIAYTNLDNAPASQVAVNPPSKVSDFPRGWKSSTIPRYNTSL